MYHCFFPWFSRCFLFLLGYLHCFLNAFVSFRRFNNRPFGLQRAPSQLFLLANPSCLLAPKKCYLIYAFPPWRKKRSRKPRRGSFVPSRCHPDATSGFGDHGTLLQGVVNAVDACRRQDRRQVSKNTSCIRCTPMKYSILFSPWQTPGTEKIYLKFVSQSFGKAKGIKVFFKTLL